MKKTNVIISRYGCISSYPNNSKDMAGMIGNQKHLFKKNNIIVDDKHDKETNVLRKEC